MPTLDATVLDMKKLLFALLLSVLLSTTLHAAAREIKLAALARPGSPQRIVAEKFKELLEAQSAGKFAVNIDSAGLGPKETDVIEGIQTNALQMGVITASSLEALNPIVRVISFPFLFRSEQQATTILDGPLGAALFRDLETIGCKGLAFSEVGFRQLSNNLRPIKTLADLHGLKIRVMPSPLHTATWLALGANPAPMPWPIYSELEQGIVDGQENPLWILETYSFFEIQKYLTLTRHSYTALIDVASLQWWNTLNRQDQEMIQEAMVQAARYQRLDQRAKEAARLIMLKKKGMIIEKHPDVEAFRGKVAGLKEMAIYREPRVQVLLAKMEEAVLLTSEPPTAVPEEQTEMPAPSPPEPDPLPTAAIPEQPAPPGLTEIPEQTAVPPQPAAPQSSLVPLQTEAEVKSAPLPPKEEQNSEAGTKPAEPERQPTALELLDAPMPPKKPVQIIHEGQATSESETLPPIIEERIPPSPDPVPQSPANSKPDVEQAPPLP